VGRRAALSLVVAIACFTIVAPRASSANTATRVRRPRVLIYGDSIVTDAHSTIASDLSAHGIFVHDASVGGTAPCDMLPFATQDVATYHPDVVVIAYVGNAITPCMAGTAAAHQSLQRHYADTIQLIKVINRPVVLATPPGAIGDPLDTQYRTMLKLVQQATGRTTLVADTATALLDPRTRRFETTMPCTKHQRCKRVTVRKSDHYHLNAAGGERYGNFLSHELDRLLDSTRHALRGCEAADPTITTPLSVPYVATFTECRKRSLIGARDYGRVLATAKAARFVSAS
jgi:hypothetical protein